MKINENMEKYSNSLKYKILVRLVPNGFLKYITYNALLDFAGTLKTTYRIREINVNEGIIDETLQYLEETYGIKKT